MDQIDKSRIIKYRIQRTINFLILASAFNWHWLSAYVVDGGFDKNTRIFVSLLCFVIFAIWGSKLDRTKKLLGIKSSILAPVDVIFEKTDDVSENIRRYKLAQQKAIEKIKEEKLKHNWFSRIIGR